MVYLDNNSTTCVSPEVLECMVPFFCENYFNSTSTAGELFNTQDPILKAKSELAKLLNASPDEFVLTSGATESNNWVVRAAFERSRPMEGNIVVSSIEHPSILEPVRSLASSEKNIDVRYLPVTRDGVVDLDQIENLVDDHTLLFSLMLANNETGAIQPVAESSALVRSIAPNCLIHTDATQAIGKIPVDLSTGLKDVDLLSLSAHKFHGPKGIGALFIRETIRVLPLLYGGGQQNGLRSGTENPPLAAGLAQAVRLLNGNAGILETSSTLLNLRKTLEDKLTIVSSDVRILSRGVTRLPGTSMVILPEDSDYVVSFLMQNEIFVSTGSACSSGSDAPSHVLSAMGLGYDLANKAIRISMSRENTVDDIESIYAHLANLISSGSIS